MKVNTVNESYLNADVARELFTYSNGELIRNIGRRGKSPAGSVAGSKARDGYLRVTCDYRSYQVHRVIWLVVYGEWPNGFIDHIDHNRTNNLICNLRVTTMLGNGRNQSMHKDNSSGVNGVHWHIRDKTWNARIQVNGKGIHLGTFTTLDNASKARADADIKYKFHENHGESK